MDQQSVESPQVPPPIPQSIPPAMPQPNPAATTAAYNSLTFFFILGIGGLVAVTALCGFILWKHNKLSSELIIYPDHVETNNVKVSSAISSAASWKSYADTVYGFSFKYPQEMGDVQPTKGSQIQKMLPSDYVLLQNHTYTTPYTIKEIQITINTTNQNSLDTLESIFSDTSLQNSQGISQLKRVNISNAPMLSFIQQSQVPGNDQKTTSVVYLLVDAQKHLFQITFPISKNSEKNAAFIETFMKQLTVQE